MRTSVTIRGQEFDVEFRDHGWEPDTNAHDIDWHFVDADAPKDLTAEEEDAVYLQLARREHEHFPDDFQRPEEVGLGCKCRCGKSADASGICDDCFGG